MKFQYSLATICLVAAAMITPAHADSTDGSSQWERGKHGQMNQEDMHKRIEARLEKLKTHLAITSKQQAAWDEFAKAVAVSPAKDMKRPAEDSDAATLVRFKADMATKMADKLKHIADATEKLQSVLSADQQKKLNEVARHFLNGKHGHHQWQHSHHEHHDDKAESRQ